MMMSREWATLDEATQKRIRDHQSTAPVRLSEIANVLGLKLISSPLPAGISGEIRPNPVLDNSFVIKVNRNDSKRRQRFTVAHEMGHYLLHQDVINDGITDDVLYRSNLSDRREAEANRIAADLLMPEHLIKYWLDRAEMFDIDDTLGFLSDKFKVSVAAMSIRLGLV